DPIEQTKSQLGFGSRHLMPQKQKIVIKSNLGVAPANPANLPPAFFQARLDSTRCGTAFINPKTLVMK
ncbi:hypothetical protein, partial [Akkermansia sp.]|uniref:hypothetical protein n=1 Tax=Akkermansia sp. TaxID=1872421 RepID=UPI003AB19055